MDEKRLAARHAIMNFHYREKGQYEGQGFREGETTTLCFKASGVRMKSDILTVTLNLEEQCFPNSEREGLPV